jgi:hypothetical protein
LKLLKEAFSLLIGPFFAHFSGRFAISFLGRGKRLMWRFIRRFYYLCAIGAGALLLTASIAGAGPVIIDGTDANDHGSVSGGVNQNGWAYMQSALENVGGQVATGVTKNVVVLGTTGGQAGAAIDSAFNLSSLPGAGWTLQHIDGTTDIENWLNNLSTVNTGILYIPTAGQTSGDLTDAELGVINTHGADIASFVGGAGDPTQGGGLFAMGESPGTGTTAYGWLSSVIPGITINDVGAGGEGTTITLTTDGTSAFPSLSNTALANADPWHNYFSGSFGSLKVLGVADFNGSDVPVILGGGAGTVIDPTPVDPIPEPGTLFLLGSGLIGLAIRKWVGKNA